MSKDRYLSADIVNRGRQPELDLMKAVVIFYMPLVHATIECVPEDALVSGVPYLMDTILGGPFGAPLFMLAMGIGIAYSSQGGRSAGYFLKRGLKALVIGYILNLCRFIIPHLIGYAITGDAERYTSELVYLFFENDIMIFAGLAFIIIALFIKYKVPDQVMLLIALAMSICGTALNGLDVGNPAGNIFLGYLFGTEDAAGLVKSYFVLFNWFIVPVAGYVLGKVLLRIKDKAAFYKRISIPSGIIAAVIMTYGYVNLYGMFGEGQNCYYHILTTDIIAATLGAIAILGLCYVIVPHLGKTVSAIVLDVSRNINSVYCIHWVLIGFVIHVFINAVLGIRETSEGAALLVGLGIGIAAMTIAHFWNLQRRRRA